MAAAEAMAWGLPGVSFDLEALKTYYPKGMVKTPCFANNKFAQNIIDLLTNQKTYRQYSQEARQLSSPNGTGKKDSIKFTKQLPINRLCLTKTA